MSVLADRTIIRDLARRIKGISASPQQKELSARFCSINNLQPQKPPVSIFLPPRAVEKLFAPKRLRCENEALRRIEYNLRTQLNRHELLPADMPLSDTYYTGFHATISSWNAQHHTVRANSDGTATNFKPFLKDIASLALLKKPQLHEDAQKTLTNYLFHQELFGDILDVIAGTPFSSTCGWGESMIDELAEMRGLEQLYYDMVDQPEFIHRAMRLMTDAKLELLTQYKAANMLVPNNGANLVGSCGRGFCPQLDASSHQITEQNLWGFAQAQELSGVSTEMLEEFVLPYQAELVNRFGLTTYGCCESMDRKIEIVAKHIKNLRALSISPYSNLEIAASQCRGRFVMVYKVHPGLAACFDEARVRAEISKVIRQTMGCCITINFAEIMHYGNDETVFLKLARIAKQVLDEYYT